MDAKGLLLIGAAVLTLAAGCSREAVIGAGAGAAVAGGAYEYQNKKAIDDLEAQYRRGEISQSEYANNRKWTEYILIGTLLSFGLAILTGLAVR